MDRLTERIAEMDRLAQERALVVRSRLASAVDLLRKKGACRVWLFGSLTIGGHPHGQSDVDLAVEGLPAEGLIRTLLEVEEILGTANSRKSPRSCCTTCANCTKLIAT